MITIELVDFESRRLERGRMIGHAGQRIAHAQYHPTAGWRCPIERSVGVHPVGQIQDTSGRDKGISVRRRTQGVIIIHQSESGLALELIHAARLVQRELAQQERFRAGNI